MTASEIIDVHTHVYLPRYLSILRERKVPPRIFKDSQGLDRLIILPSEELDPSTAQGRPIGPEYSDPLVKIEFMKMHKITTSILSFGNPWLDFLPADESAPLATLLNKDLQQFCLEHDEYFYGFGILPTTSPKDCILELERIAKLSKLRGAIIGTQGCGAGLDDPAWLPVFAAATSLNILLFLHPHYGIPSDLYGGLANGHVLPLALGFPFETTIAVSRMILAGVFDAYPDLKLLLAHSGGTLPFLAGRLDSCVAHDPHLVGRLLHPPSYYLGKLYYDAVNYHKHGLMALDSLIGIDRIMFGTDNPFFPPLDEDAESWESVDSIYRAIDSVFKDKSKMVLAGNAKRILGIGE